ncbi:hypothetical protein FOL47_005457 [Perkinsus chesapeaki]|uniref:Purple acid phosphatase n=1 Tax=Perkinsus chesapeaki TaxID=330153 RepID=A0A7J6LXK5_PERCH|nr:hypothetical protein FOL47_005457 [Perkinsus chesapeaki]
MPPIAVLLVVSLLVIYFGIIGCSNNNNNPSVEPTTAKPTAGTSCISLSTNQLQHSYDPVKVTWHQPVNDGDTIEFRLNDTSGPFLASAFRILVASLNNTDNEYEIRPVNPRGGGYIVTYVKSDGNELCSTHLTFAQGDDEPNQAHITVVGEDQLQVNWVSASSQPGEVLYQTVDGTNWISHKETTNPRTYKGSDMCFFLAENIGFRNPGFFHSVTLPNFPFGSRLQIRNDGSESRQFRPHPRILPGDAARHSVALFGDLGVTGSSISGGARGFGTMEFPPVYASHPLDHVRDNDRIRLAILYGDVAYSGGYGIVWDQFGAEMEDGFAMRTPFAASVGNHEYCSTGNPKGWYPEWGNYNSLDSGGECGVPFSHRYHRGDGINQDYWFSFNFGLVHYVMLSTEHNYLNGSDQNEWLDKDLSEVDRSKTPWIIVIGHRPMYYSCQTAGQPDGEIAAHLASDVGPLLMKYDVDVYATGHVHHYERTSAINGTVHVLSGSMRFMEGSCSRSDLPWLKVVLETYGYVELDVINSTLLNFTYWGYNDTLGSIEVQDTFVVSK